MSKVIALVSAKGGVGKTCIAVNLAHLCAFCGLKTLLVDCDIHTNGATAFYRRKKGAKTLYENSITFLEIVHSSLPMAREIQPLEIEENLGLIPGGHYWGYSSSGNEQALYSRLSQEQLAKFINGCVDSYDVILLDQGAGYNYLIESMIAFATTVLVVKERDKISLELTRNLFESIKFSRKRLVFCDNKISKNQTEYAQICREQEEGILHSCIGFRYDTDVIEKTEAGECIDVTSTSLNGEALLRIARLVLGEYAGRLDAYLEDIAERKEAERKKAWKQRMEKETKTIQRELSLWGKGAFLEGLLVAIVAYVIQRIFFEGSVIVRLLISGSLGFGVLIITIYAVILTNKKYLDYIFKEVNSFWNRLKQQDEEDV